MIPAPSIRQLRFLRALSRRWQRRIIFIAGGLCVGLAAIGLAVASDYAQALFRELLMRFRYAAFIVTPLGFGAAVYLTNRFFPNTQGSGIPQAIAAREIESPGAREKLVGLHTGLGKILMTLLGLLVGASIGREGPTVQVGASIMFAIGRLSPNRQPGLILAGAAAGVAAAFNTPIAGIVFAIEEMGRSFETRTSGLVFGTIILAGFTSFALVGNYTYFGSTAAVLGSPANWLAVPVCGVVCGLAGGLFSRALIVVPTHLPQIAKTWLREHTIAFAVMCGFGVALCGFLSGGAAYGTGYVQAREALHGGASVSVFYAPLKFAATALSSVCGLPGGIFSPSLSVGAGLGADIAQFFPKGAMGAVVLLGMVSYFTGVVQAPITAFVIVEEMTGNHGMLVPLMAAAWIANGMSRLVCREGVYHALSKRFLPHD
ncbi:MAG TPA: chloride channel protein [Rhizomicrobium sp.]|nr:chloride channel protein [Rhizomicrobium sp.]